MTAAQLDHRSARRSSSTQTAQSVTVDVNVLLHMLAGHPSHGQASRNFLAGALVDPRFVPRTSQHVLDNVYDKLVNAYGVHQEIAIDVVDEIEELFREQAPVLDPEPGIGQWNLDREDSEILALASASDSVAIVTHDERDLLSLGTWQGRPIMSAARINSMARQGLMAATRSPQGQDLVGRLDQMASAVSHGAARPDHSSHPGHQT